MKNGYYQSINEQPCIHGGKHIKIQTYITGLSLEMYKHCCLADQTIPYSLTREIKKLLFPGVFEEEFRREISRRGCPNIYCEYARNERTKVPSSK